MIDKSVSWEVIVCLNNFWTLVILLYNNLLSDGSSIFLRPGAYAMRHSLFSPPNINTNEWKCLHLWYLIGGSDGYEASITVLLNMLTSNLTILLFFADKATSEATYTQTPLPRNFTDAQVFTNRSCCNFRSFIGFPSFMWIGFILDKFDVELDKHFSLKVILHT